MLSTAMRASISALPRCMNAAEHFLLWLPTERARVSPCTSFFRVYALITRDPQGRILQHQKAPLQVCSRALFTLAPHRASSCVAKVKSPHTKV